METQTWQDVRIHWGTLLAIFAGASAQTAIGAPLTLTYDSFIESKTIQTPLASDRPIRLDGRLRDIGGGAIDNRFVFVPDSSSLSLSAGWLIQPPGNRTIGVNIDLVDGFNNVVSTDVFLGLDGSLARSQMTATNLVPFARYQLVFTGNAAESGRYQVDLVSGATPPPIAPVAVATPPADRAVFDTEVGSKDFGSILAPGGRLQIEGILGPEQVGALTNEIDFATTSSTLSAGITWLVSAPGDPRRLVGVNVDLLDGDGNVVSTDAFEGLFDGQAFSRFSVAGLTPGLYSLRLTGNAIQEARYRIDLETSATAPDFRPIIDDPVAVPEPATWKLMLAAMLGVGILGALRSRQPALDAAGATALLGHETTARAQDTYWRNSVDSSSAG